MFILNPSSGIPIYRQLVEQITRLIGSGQLAAGDPLPSVRELAQTHAVNPMTISKAYSMLEAEGLLERNRGKPMTVRRQSAKSVGVAAREAQIEEPVEALVLAARQLAMSRSEVVRLLKRKWEEGG